MYFGKTAICTKLNPVILKEQMLALKTSHTCKIYFNYMFAVFEMWVCLLGFSDDKKDLMLRSS